MWGRGGGTSSATQGAGVEEGEGIRGRKSGMDILTSVAIRMSMTAQGDRGWWYNLRAEHVRGCLAWGEAKTSAIGKQSGAG